MPQKIQPYSDLIAGIKSPDKPIGLRRPEAMESFRSMSLFASPEAAAARDLINKDEEEYQENRISSNYTGIDLPLAESLSKETSKASDIKDIIDTYYSPDIKPKTSNLSRWRRATICASMCAKLEKSLKEKNWKTPDKTRPQTPAPPRMLSAAPRPPSSKRSLSRSPRSRRKCMPAINHKQNNRNEEKENKQQNNCDPDKAANTLSVPHSDQQTKQSPTCQFANGEEKESAQNEKEEESAQNETKEESAQNETEEEAAQNETEEESAPQNEKEEKTEQNEKEEETAQNQTSSCSKAEHKSEYKIENQTSTSDSDADSLSDAESDNMSLSTKSCPSIEIEPEPSIRFRQRFGRRFSLPGNTTLLPRQFCPTPPSVSDFNRTIPQPSSGRSKQSFSPSNLASPKSDRKRSVSLSLNLQTNRAIVTGLFQERSSMISSLKSSDSCSVKSDDSAESESSGQFPVRRSRLLNRRASLDVASLSLFNQQRVSYLISVQLLVKSTKLLPRLRGTIIRNIQTLKSTDIFLNLHM